MNLRAVAIVGAMVAALAGCGPEDSDYNISPDPYPERIEELAASLELTDEFAERFLDDYRKSVSEEIELLKQEGDPDEYRITVHFARSYTYYNMWGAEGVDIVPPSTSLWHSEDRDAWRERLLEMTTRLQEYQIEIADLRQRIDELRRGAQSPQASPR